MNSGADPLNHHIRRPSVAFETIRRDSDYRQQGDCLSAHPLGLTFFALLYLDGVHLYYFSMQDLLRLCFHLSPLFSFLMRLFSPCIFYIYRTISFPLFILVFVVYSNQQSDHTTSQDKTNCMGLWYKNKQDKKYYYSSEELNPRPPTTSRGETNRHLHSSEFW